MHMANFSIFVTHFRIPTFHDNIHNVHVTICRERIFRILPLFFSASPLKLCESVCLEVQHANIWDFASMSTWILISHCKVRLASRILLRSVPYCQIKECGGNFLWQPVLFSCCSHISNCIWGYEEQAVLEWIQNSALWFLCAGVYHPIRAFISQGDMDLWLQ